MKRVIVASVTLLALSLLGGCANPSACMGSTCVSINKGELANLTPDEESKVERGELVKIQQWATNNGATYPAEVPENQLELIGKGASKLSARDYPKGVSVCVHANLVCQPNLTSYVSSVLEKKYGFRILKDAASADAVFYIDSSIFYGISHPDLASSIEYAITALKMPLGENNDQLDINGLPLMHIPRENKLKVVTINLVKVDVRNAEPFAGYGMVKRGAGALWYKKGSTNPRYSLSGVCSNKVSANDAAFKMFLQVLDEFLARAVEKSQPAH